MPISDEIDNDFAIKTVRFNYSVSNKNYLKIVILDMRKRAEQGKSHIAMHEKEC